MTVRIMYDSVTAADIPATAGMVAGYVDGPFVWKPEDWTRFPTAIWVGIATHPATDEGDVLDVEVGDATPGQVPGWLEKRLAAGLERPTVYCAASVISLIQAACTNLPYALWVADWTGTPHRIAEASAVQYADPATSGGHYDLSAVYDPLWPYPRVEEKGMDLATAQLHVWEWYTMYCGRIGTQAEVDYWAVQLAAPGANYEGVVSSFYATPEAVAWRERKA